MGSGFISSGTLKIYPNLYAMQSAPWYTELLLDGQNTPYVLLSVIGVMVETIVIMAAYSLVIVKKYEEK